MKDLEFSNTWRKLVQHDKLVFLICLKLASRLFHCNFWKCQERLSRGQFLHTEKSLNKKEKQEERGQKGGEKDQCDCCTGQPVQPPSIDANWQCCSIRIVSSKQTKPPFSTTIFLANF